MVKLKSIFIAALSLFFVIPTHAQARVVSQVDVEGVGLIYDGRNDKNEEEACKVFKPTKKQVVQFFNKAKESKKHGTLLHEYYSPCISLGAIKFEDGSSGRWTLQSSGLAFVIFDNGESATFFHKGNQWTDPYACTYGLGDDLIC